MFLNCIFKFSLQLTNLISDLISSRRMSANSGPSPCHRHFEELRNTGISQDNLSGKLHMVLVKDAVVPGAKSSLECQLRRLVLKKPRENENICTSLRQKSSERRGTASDQEGESPVDEGASAPLGFSSRLIEWRGAAGATGLLKDSPLFWVSEEEGGNPESPGCSP